MAGLTTNLNVAPFYDDFDESKDYYRILFRPATAVQARELTQLQTILQNQISRFGDSIYKDGSVIEGCNFTSYPNIQQIKFLDSNSSTLDFSTLTTLYADIAEDANNTVFNASNTYLLVSNTNGLRASIFRAYYGTQNQAPYTNRAYVQYLNVGNNSVTDFGQTSQQIDVYSSHQDKLGPLSASNRLGVIYTLTSNSTVNALAVGYGMRVGKGIIYQKGFFLRTAPSNFIISENVSNAAGIVIGFNTAENIITPYQDPSLFDNSQGSTNYSAPGAYRLQLVPSPVFYNSSNTSTPVPNSFLTIVSFDQGTGQFITQENNIQYSTLGDTLATRTMETNGNFVVKPFAVNVTGNLNDSNYFYYTASAGTAYIDGYRVDIRSPIRVLAPRGIYTRSITGDALSTSLGNYYFVNEVAGVPDVQAIESVTLYDSFQKTLSQFPSRSSPSGNVLGTANVKAYKFYSGIKGTPTAIYQLYLFNIQLNAGVNSSSVKSIYGNGTYGALYADIVPDPYTGLSVLNESSVSVPIYSTGVSGLKTLTSGGVNGTTFTYTPVLTASLTPVTHSGIRQSVATFTVPGPDIFTYGTGFLDDTTSAGLNITFAQDTFSNTLTYNASIYSGSSNVITSSDSFTGGLYVGDSIAITNTGTSTTQYATISQINSSNSITVNTTLTGSGLLQLQQFFKKGEAINFNGSGNTIQQTSTTSITIDIALDPASVSYNLNAQIPLLRTSANPIKKIVNKNQYVKIDCSTNPGGTTGPWSLGISDVYQISNVFVGSTYSVSNPNQAQWFSLDTGQRGSYYGNARLSLLPQYNGSLTTASKLLVELNCFTPQMTTSQAGFYSVDSYPIDDINPSTNANAIATAQIPVFTDSTNLQYDLRNYIDMRPMLANTAVITSNVSLATVNPTFNTNTFITSNNISIDVDKIFTYNATYYLPRIDTLVITKTGLLVNKLGVSDLNPQPASINKTGMPIAQIYVPPYPSLTFAEAQ